MRPKFTVEQRSELLSLPIYPEQVHRLETYALSSISWRLVRPPRMRDVREKLEHLATALERVERLYVRISTSAGASAEASSRLYLAQEALGFSHRNQVDTLHDSLETATKIVNRALADVPKKRRTTRQNSTEFVQRILDALMLGHVDHFRCSGFGDTPLEPAPMPGFLITVARKAGLFPEVARIVSEASGGWSSDDAIRAYLKKARRRRAEVFQMS